MRLMVSFLYRVLHSWTQAGACKSRLVSGPGYSPSRSQNAHGKARSSPCSAFLPSNEKCKSPLISGLARCSNRPHSTPVGASSLGCFNITAQWWWVVVVAPWWWWWLRGGSAVRVVVVQLVVVVEQADSAAAHSANRNQNLMTV